MKHQLIRRNINFNNTEQLKCHETFDPIDPLQTATHLNNEIMKKTLKDDIMKNELK